MAIRKLPSGTHGVRTPPRLMGRVMTPVLVRVHRFSGNRFAGMDLLYLTTLGARSGQARVTPLARFDDGSGGWLVVASAGGAATHPGWYHNIAAHPDEVAVEVDGVRHQVEVHQLEREDRDAAWKQILGQSPRFGGYQQKTDRELPVLRLTPVS